MTKPLKTRKTKRSIEINWKIREIFSEAALASFCDEIDSKYLAIEKTKINSWIQLGARKLYFALFVIMKSICLESNSFFGSSVDTLFLHAPEGIESSLHRALEYEKS